jgi:hypothetical protein
MCLYLEGTYKNSFGVKPIMQGKISGEQGGPAPCPNQHLLCIHFVQGAVREVAVLAPYRWRYCPWSCKHAPAVTELRLKELRSPWPFFLVIPSFPPSFRYDLSGTGKDGRTRKPDSGAFSLIHWHSLPGTQETLIWSCLPPPYYPQPTSSTGLSRSTSLCEQFPGDKVYGAGGEVSRRGWMRGGGRESKARGGPIHQSPGSSLHS